MTIESIATKISSYLPDFRTRIILLIALLLIIIFTNLLYTTKVRKKTHSLIQLVGTLFRKLLHPFVVFRNFFWSKLTKYSFIKKTDKFKKTERGEKERLLREKGIVNKKFEKKKNQNKFNLPHSRKLLLVLLIGNLVIIGLSLSFAIICIFPVWEDFSIDNNILIWGVTSLVFILVLFNSILISLKKKSSEKNAMLENGSNSSLDKVLEFPPTLSNPFNQEPTVNNNLGFVNKTESTERTESVKERRSKKEKGVVNKKLRACLKSLFIKISELNYGKIFLALFNTVVLFSIIIIVFSTIFTKSVAVLANPKQGQHITDGHTAIEVTFTTPVYKELLELNISPEIKGEWEIKDLIPNGNTPYALGAIFHPAESFPAEKKVVLYLVGLKRLASGGHIHEQALEFWAPKIPEVENVYPNNNAKNIRVNQNIIFTYTSPIGEFSQIEHHITPEIKFTVTNQGNTHQLLQFDEPLKQNTTYKIETYRTLRTYNPTDFSNINRGETKLINTLSFTTVAAPSIKEYSPKKDGVLADTPITIEFLEDMDRNSVKNAFKIVPKTEGTISWQNEKTFHFTPAKNLQKETDYKITFDKGMLTRYGGQTKKKIELKFTTIGKVKVIQIKPRHKSTNIEPINASVTIKFNQEVNKASAEEKFSISPNVDGTFSWKDNNMTYRFNHNLAYSKRYNITVKSGVKTVHGLDSAKDFSYYFTTRSNRFELNVPLLYQNESHTCNIAATRMTLAYRGIHLSENQIRNSIGRGDNPNEDWVSGYGVHWGPVAQFIRQYRTAEIHHGWNTADLAREVQNGNPVILFWNNRYTSGRFTLPSGVTGYHGMHSEVVRGFIGPVNNPTALLTNDPWRGHLIYSRSLFDNTWSYLNYTAIVVK